MNVENPLLIELLDRTNEAELNKIRKELNLVENIKAILEDYQDSTGNEIKFVHPKLNTSHRGFYEAYRSILAQEKGVKDPTSIPLHDLDFTNLRLTLSEYKDLVQYDDVDEVLGYWEKQDPQVENSPIKYSDEGLPIEENTKPILNEFDYDNEQWELDRLVFQRRRTASQITADTTPVAKGRLVTASDLDDEVEELIRSRANRDAMRNPFEQDQESGETNTTTEPADKSNLVTAPKEDKPDDSLPLILRRRTDPFATATPTGPRSETKITASPSRVIRLNGGFDKLRDVLNKQTDNTDQRVSITATPADLARYAKSLTIPVNKLTTAKLNQLEFALTGGPEGNTLILNGEIDVRVGLGISRSVGSILFGGTLKNDPKTGELDLSGSTYKIPPRFEDHRGNIEETINNLNRKLIVGINKVVQPTWETTGLTIGSSELVVNLVRSNAA